MTGEINKGDAILFEQREQLPIEVEQIILFKKNGRLTVHRVVDIQTVNGERRYVTKGDANADPDAGYIIDADIVGVCRAKLPFVGYPTLWLRELLNPTPTP